jgi:PAS domain S-box-containing protein
LLFSFISYLWAPKKRPFPFSLITYLLLASTTAALIYSTGNTSSVYLAVWVLICIFAGVFGLWGIMPIFITSCIFTSIQYLNNNFSIEVIITILLSSLVPLIVGAIVWHQKQGTQPIENENNQYKNELSELASKSEVIIDAIGDGVITINSNGLIQLINPAAQALIGWSKQDALTLNYKSVLQLVNQKNEELDTLTDPIQQVLNTNQQVRTNNLSLVTKTGKKLMISLVISPVGDMGSGIIAVFHDITSEKAEEREQAEFISTASHEMRTPVASIEGYLGLAINPQTAQIDDRARDYIQKAHASAQHLGRLFQDLLDVSKADDGRISNNPKVINIVTFIHDVAQGLQEKANEKGIRLIYKPMPDDNVLDKNIAPVFSVNLDNDHIREVINNLIENAIKYTPKGEVVIDVTGDEDHVVISIKDSGIGIPAEDMPHLFQKFYRVDNKDTREIGGTGLGLYLSRRLVEIMGGRIWAESIYTQGSTFFVELPRIDSQEAMRIAEQELLKAQEEAMLGSSAQSNGSTIPTTVSNQPAFQPLAPALNPVQDVSLSLEPSQPKLNEVPRGQALTAEQIAAYVTKQRQLAAQQAASQPTQQTSQPTQQPTGSAPAPVLAQTQTRPRAINIPNREPHQ